MSSSCWLCLSKTWSNSHERRPHKEERLILKDEKLHDSQRNYCWNQWGHRRRVAEIRVTTADSGAFDRWRAAVRLQNRKLSLDEGVNVEKIFTVHLNQSVTYRACCGWCASICGCGRSISVNVIPEKKSIIFVFWLLSNLICLLRIWFVF